MFSSPGQSNKYIKQYHHLHISKRHGKGLGFIIGDQANDWQQKHFAIRMRTHPLPKMILLGKVSVFATDLV